MSLQTTLQSLQDTPFATTIAESAWMFPTIETVHVLALATVIGTITMMDLRLLGLAHRTHAVTHLAEDTLPWTWGAFVIAAITGSTLFTTKAVEYSTNPFFLTKMCLLAAAGLNMLVFHVFTYKSVAEWDQTTPAPSGARIAGLLSLVFWIGVVICGRWIGFTLHGPNG